MLQRRSEAGDVVLDRPGEQAGGLRQIADMTRKIVAGPRLIGRAVQSNDAGTRLHAPSQNSRQRRLT
ncbi:hypothetical protein D3C72_2413190 [compost metagenome]